MKTCVLVLIFFKYLLNYNPYLNVNFERWSHKSVLNGFEYKYIHSNKRKTHECYWWISWVICHCIHSKLKFNVFKINAFILMLNTFIIKSVIQFFILYLWFDFVSFEFRNKQSKDKRENYSTLFFNIKIHSYFVKI